MNPPQLGHPPLKHLIVSGPLHFGTRYLPQILVTALTSLFIREIIIGTGPILFGTVIVLRKARGNRILPINIPHEGV
jgi:hypothetical protein